jgi:two-component system response regulator HydG
MHRLLIIHCDPSVRALMSSMLQGLGHRIDEAASDRAAVRMLEQSPFQLVLAGADGDFDDVLELVNYVRRKHAGTPVLLFAEAPRPEHVREAMQRGALSVLRFPLPATQLRAAVSQAMPAAAPCRHETNGKHDVGAAAPSANGHANGEAHLGFESGPAVATAAAPRTLAEPIGEDPTWRQVLDLAEAIAPRRSPVLLVGERGAGKALLARRLHQGGSRRDGPFLTIVCQGRDEAEVEAELFGQVHPETGAVHPGLLARASGGTLLIDEVQSLSPATQAQLVRALRDGEYRPCGGDRPLRLECRLVAGCSEELGPLVERGLFRSDLFYVLSAVTLKLPPLRHRGQDVLRLAEHFRESFAHEAGKSVVGISPDALRRLAAHDWPGNVLELKEVIRRAVARCRGHWIEATHLDLGAPPASRLPGTRGASARPNILPLKEALEEPEKRLILEALRALNWNRQETAKVLDINRTTLYKKMKKYGLIFEEPAWTN